MRSRMSPKLWPFSPKPLTIDILLSLSLVLCHPGFPRLASLFQGWHHLSLRFGKWRGSCGLTLMGAKQSHLNCSYS